MSEELPVLSVGNPVFEVLRQKREVYVDKSKYIPMLSEWGQFIFCARPRRFGKSLTVSTLDAFYSGRIDLFRGLAVEELMSSPAFAPRPVIRLDMSIPADSKSVDILEENIKILLEANADRHQVSLRGPDYATAFFCLLNDVRKRIGQKVVLLIDEYDSPVISLAERDKLTFNAQLLADTRIVMRNFYREIKSASEFIELVFITGCTKFSRMGVFSSL
ncbi:MAG: AAA family ATPase, partial [Deltaproteobacteria bacterium]|nr:AAA family ATPase [Deltaproteobacteria bacterium]